VREAALDVCRAFGLTTWFGNPGSTEIPLLADLPDDIRYVLCLHENAAVSAASGFALGSGRPAMVSLHTTAGLGIRAIADAGAVVLLCSTDNQELVDLCSRVAVFYRGAVTGELTGDHLAEHTLLEAINTGVVEDAA